MEVNDMDDTDIILNNDFVLATRHYQDQHNCAKLSTLYEVLDQINQGSRIVICGAISTYNTGNMYKKGGTQGPCNYIELAETSSSMSGLMVGHFLASSLNLARCVSYLMWHHYHRGNLKPY
jgi:hypothetical protein